jgi:hypothetical protein
MFVTGEISPSNIGLTSFVNASKSVSRSDFAGGVLQRDRHTVCPCRRSMVGDKPHGISIKGRVNIDTSGDMRRTIADASRSRPPAVMLDLSRVSYLDTSDMEAFAPSRRQRSDKVQWQILHDRLARPRAGATASAGRLGMLGPLFAVAQSSTAPWRRVRSIARPCWRRRR